MEINIILPDGSVKKLPAGTTVEELARSIGPGLARDAVAARFEGRLIGLAEPLEHGGHITILTFDDPEGRDVYRHSAAHVMAQAVKRLYPDARLGIGPAIADGFYYDFDIDEALTPEDLERIEAVMWEIVDEDTPFECIALEKDEALDLF